jgi:hypothetical protein
MRRTICGAVLGIFLAAGIQRGSADYVFFIDHPGRTTSTEWSWGIHSEPSDLELGQPQGDTGRFPIQTGVSWRGRNALKLAWTSRAEGDWAVCIAAPGWESFDLTKATRLRFWVNGPAAIGREALPDVALQDTENHISARAWLGDYLPELDEDEATWQAVDIPLAVFQPGLKACDLARIKTVYFLQRLPDGEEHVLWIDNLRVLVPGTPPPVTPVTPEKLVAEGADSRVDLQWQPADGKPVAGYYVYAAPAAEGPFTPVADTLHRTSLYSDFIGTNDVTRWYRVTAVNEEFEESPPSPAVSGTSWAMTDDQLLTSIQKAAFRYFYDYAHPVSGLARERLGSGDIVTIGGTGFGLMNMIVAVERGFVSREDAVAHINKILKFLDKKADRFHGVWPHWLHGATGKTYPFGQFDDGGDLVETAFLAQGLLTVRTYFDGDNRGEKALRKRATRLWEGIEWDWYRHKPDGRHMIWHWSPKHGWHINHHIIGFNECMIVYVLGAASPTHPIDPSLYYKGWAGESFYANGHEYFGIPQMVGPPRGGPLFFTHYSFLGLNPHAWDDGFCNYFENNRNISLIHRAYAIENPKRFPDYGEDVWGFTASDNPWGYGAQEPVPEKDNGTVSPTAAVSAYPYVPQESMSAMRTLYHRYGHRLWGEFGFRDAFNVQQDWFADSVLAIDQGPMAPMIENGRTGLCWKYFMANEEVVNALEAIRATKNSVIRDP